MAKVAAVGLNFFDTLIIAGKYQKKPPFPFSPGGEFAGTVESVGAGVSGFAPGDRVLGYCTYGAARERIAVGGGQARRSSTADLDLDARGRPRHHLWHELARAHRPRASQGRRDAGGAGRRRRRRPRGGRARQAHGRARDRLRRQRRQARLRTRPRRRRDRELCQRRICASALKELGGEHGIDVIFDPVGGAYSEAALRAIAWEGRHLVVGFAAGEIPKLPLNLTLLKGCDVRRRLFWRLGAIRAAGLSRRAQPARALGRRRQAVCHVHRSFRWPKRRGAQGADRPQAMGKVIVRP